MPQLKSKSRENFKAAQILFDAPNQMYVPSVHCAYYSCLQLVKHVLCNYCIIPYYLQKVSGKGSHDYVVDMMRNNLEQMGINKAVSNLFTFRIYELKRLRQKADYDNERIEKTDA
ncbi:hypothetical protein EZS27_035740, partial [termite gut metagenome]